MCVREIETESSRGEGPERTVRIKCTLTSPVSQSHSQPASHTRRKRICTACEKRCGKETLWQRGRGGGAAAFVVRSRVQCADTNTHNVCPRRRRRRQRRPNRHDKSVHNEDGLACIRGAVVVIVAQRCCEIACANMLVLVLLVFVWWNFKIVRF